MINMALPLFRGDFLRQRTLMPAEERVVGEYADWVLDGLAMDFHDNWEDSHYVVRFEGGYIYLTLQK